MPFYGDARNTNRPSSFFTLSALKWSNGVDIPFLFIPF